jgi:hypothetical protein
LSLVRHALPCAGHPRLSFIRKQDVDDGHRRAKARRSSNGYAGHDAR